MFRYRLRTLLILLAVGPPMLAVAWSKWDEWRSVEEWNFVPTDSPSLVTWDDPDISGGFLPMVPYGDADDGIMTMTPQR